jgi:DNA modification methylase
MPKRGRESKAIKESSGSPPLSVVYRHVETLARDPKNPRTHSKKQIEQIANSIKAFGFNVPFLIDREQRVIAGHGRLAACELLGIDSVPTISLQHLTEEQIRAFMIADNRLTENGAWDDQLLAQHFQALSAVDLDFSLETTGFEMGEIDVFVDNLASAPSSAEDLSDVLPESSSAVPITKAGDLWLLNQHRLFCGDALEERSYELLMDSNPASAVFIDPPFNCRIDHYVSGFGKIHHAEFAMGSGEMSSEEFTAFLSKAFSHLVRHSTLGSLHFIALDWRHMNELLGAAEKLYSELKNVCVWVKESGGQGSLYRSQHELFFVFKNGEAKHRNNIQLGQFGRYRTNVWQYPRVNPLRKNDGEDGNLLRLHPTVKPVALVADAILDCTARSDIVLDSFMGSGTTIIAAERTGRVAYGMELDPTYVDLTIRRWQNLTGLRGIHSGSGKSFCELEEASHV